MRRFFSIVLLVPFVFAPALPSAAERPKPAATGGKLLRHFSSLTLEVTNPTSAVSAAERIIRKHGGVITHSSSNNNNGNVNANVPVAQLTGLMRTLKSITGRVTNSNRSSSDMTSDMRRSKDRLHDLELAQIELGKVLKTTSAADATRGLVILHELANNERENLLRQIEDMKQNSSQAQFNISFSKPN